MKSGNAATKKCITGSAPVPRFIPDLPRMAAAKAFCIILTGSKSDKMDLLERKASAYPDLSNGAFTHLASAGMADESSIGM
jgi:hypothetical protein